LQTRAVDLVEAALPLRGALTGGKVSGGDVPGGLSRWTAAFLWGRIPILAGRIAEGAGFIAPAQGFIQGQS
jgi:hypothetical protein